MYCPVVIMSPDLSLDMKGNFVGGTKALLCLQQNCILQCQCKSGVNGCEQYREQMLVDANLSQR